MKSGLKNKLDIKASGIANSGKRLGISISSLKPRRQIIEKPELIDYSRLPLLIAQRKLDQNYVLRVVFREEGKDKIVITFYPGRIKQYAEKRETKN